MLVGQALFALCLVSALQLLVPRNMPFGVVGPSKVVAAVTSKVGLDLIGYPSQSAAMTAINRGELYGAYVTGSSSDTLIVVPAKSFFAQIELEPAFLAAAHKLGQPVTVQTAKPLPPSDPVGAVTALLLLPLLIGGYLAAVLVFKAAGGTAAAPWRAAILTGYAIVGAVLTDLIAGPLHRRVLQQPFLAAAAVFRAGHHRGGAGGRRDPGPGGESGHLAGGGVVHRRRRLRRGRERDLHAAGVLAEHRGDLPAAERGRP